MTNDPEPARELTLLQAIAFCCEKNEVFGGWAHRLCPFPSEDAAARAFAAWVEEAARWKGQPVTDATAQARRAAWPDLRIKHAGRGVGLWIKAGSVFRWWGLDATWKGDPCADVYDWDRDEEEPEDDLTGARRPRSAR